MNILLIHQAFVSPLEAGGTRHYELAQHCIGQGDRFSIVASDLSYLSGNKVQGSRGLVTEQQIGGVNVFRAYTYPSLHRSFTWRVVSFFSFMITSVWAGLRAGKIDVVMGTSPPIFQGVSAWVIAVLRRRPFLLEIRDLWPDFAIGLGVLKSRPLIFLSRWLEKFLYERATHLLVNSPAYRDYLLGKGIPAAKIAVVPNGVDPGMFGGSHNGAGLRGRWHLDAKFVVTYAGAIGLANDIATILRAADRLRNDTKIHFLLVGDGMERPKMEALACELRLHNVTFTGALPKFEMGEVLAATDVCLATLKNIPMFKTTYPNKVFDYMAAERPVILAIDGVIREVVEASNGGIFVHPGNDEELAMAVRKLRCEPDTVAAMGRSGRAYVLQHFNRHDQAARFRSLLDQLSSSRGNRESR